MCILNNQKNHNLYHHPFQGNIVPLISGNTYGHFHQIALSLPFVLYYFQLVLIFFGYMIVFCALSYKKRTANGRAYNTVISVLTVGRLSAVRFPLYRLLPWGKLSAARQTNEGISTFTLIRFRCAQPPSPIVGRLFSSTHRQK